MSDPSEGNPVQASEVLKELAPEMAWGVEYVEGVLRVSRLAVEAYALKPIVDVKPPEALDAAATGELIENIPRTNVTVVGPAEMRAVLAGINDERAREIDPSLQQIAYGVDLRKGLIDIIMGFEATVDQTEEEQVAVFERIYGEAWPAVKERNSSDEFPYHIAHVIPDATIGAIEVTFPQYRHMKGLIESIMLLDRYKASVSGSIHRVFCDEEHLPPGWEVPDAI